METLIYDVHYSESDRLRASSPVWPLCIWSATAKEVELPIELRRQPIMVRPQASDLREWMFFSPNRSVPEMISIDIEALCESHARTHWVGLRLQCKTLSNNMHNDYGDVDLLQYAPTIDILREVPESDSYRWLIGKWQSCDCGPAVRWMKGRGPVIMVYACFAITCGFLVFAAAHSLYELYTV